MAVQAMLQAVGEVRFAMLVQMGAIVCNVLLDPLLIFGVGPLPAMGVGGAALATVLVQTGALVVGVRHLQSGHSALHLRMQDFRPDWRHVRRAAALGFPASIEQGIRTFSSLLLMSLAASFGTLALATYGVGTRLLFLWFSPMIGLSIATAAVVGQNIGAGLRGARARGGAAIRLAGVPGADRGGTGADSLRAGHHAHAGTGAGGGHRRGHPFRDGFTCPSSACWRYPRPCWVPFAAPAAPSSR